jgi:hypothetical protein
VEAPGLESSYKGNIQYALHYLKIKLDNLVEMCIIGDTRLRKGG